MMQDWFRNAKLGIFIHYGIYAVGDVSESWSFHNGNISYEDYMKQCEGFTASKFDAKKWAELFQKAGAQYVVMTAKHHDGVALFDTGYSDLSVVKKTPAARDLVKEYTAAMREAGLKVGLYYSLIDWSDPRYRTVYPEGMKKEDCLNDIYGSPAGKEEEPEKWHMIMGEAKDPMILVKARITSAAYVVLPLKDPILNRKVIQYVRQLRPDIPVLVRVPDDDLPDNWTRDANTHILTNNEAMLMALLGELVRAFSRPETQQRAPEPDPEDVTPPPAGDEADDEAQPGRLGRLLGWTGLASEKLSAAAGSTAHSAGTWVKSLGGRFRRTGNKHDS